MRDVLEHTARLGATIAWDQLCAQVKGLADLDWEQQHQALKAASVRSRCVRQLTALITTEGMPHPHYRQPAGTGKGSMAQAAWQRALADVHAAYRPSPPPPGARPHGISPWRGRPPAGSTLSRPPCVWGGAVRWRSSGGSAPGVPETAAGEPALHACKF